MINNQQLWDNVLGEIELSISKANFSTWFKNTQIAKQENGIIFIAVPNEFVKDWLYKKYHKLILRSLRGLVNSIRSIDYVISKDGAGIYTNDQILNININNELPLNDLYINRKDNLNPRYTFDSFTIGDFNNMAYAASQAIIKKPGHVYNPFFIHGGTGLGKTHLIQAVGNYLKEKNSNIKIYYVTSEKFSADYINSIGFGNEKIRQFKEKYRKYDILIMDDIQFVANKPKTQEELFHLFNSLYDDNKQIIFSSDLHPNFMPGLEERLKSRFNAGMIVDIAQPEFESRLAIIKNKFSLRRFSIPEKSIHFLANSIQGNIRDIEGVINSVIIKTQMKNKDLSLDEIKLLIKNSVKPKRNVSVKDIVKTITSFYDIAENSIYEKTRKKEVVKPRQIIMYILREDFSISYPSIGDKLGKRDHTTVIHSCEKIKRELLKSNELVQEIEQIRSMI